MYVCFHGPGYNAGLAEVLPRTVHGARMLRAHRRGRVAQGRWCQIQNNYVDTNTLKEFEHLYELTPYEIEYDFNIYQEIKIDIIRLKRIIDLCNSDAYYDIKNLDSQNFRFLKTKELKLLKLLSVKDLHKLDHALYVLNTTNNDWVVIQSYIEIIHAFNN